MTKIKVDQNSILQLGISQVAQGNVAQALGNFAKVNTYESMLNQLACLCCLGENFYAIDHYKKMSCVFFETHNVLCDVASLGSCVTALLSIVEHDFSDNVIYSENRISADKSLIADFSAYDVEMPDAFADLEKQLSQTNDIFCNSAKKAQFFDLKSSDYPRQLQDAIYQASAEGNYNQLQSLAQLLWKVKSDQTDVVETQLSLCLYFKKYKLGKDFVKQLAFMLGVSQEGALTALEILSNDKKPNVGLTARFVSIAYNNMSTLEEGDLHMVLRLATNVCHDYTLAKRLAEELLLRETTIVESLKICAYAFYNAKDFVKLKRTLAKLRNILPRDVFGAFMFDYVKYVSPQKQASHFKIPSQIGMHLQLPQEFVDIARNEFMQRDEEDLIITNYQLLYVEALIEQCKYQGLEGKFEHYAKLNACVRVILDYFRPEDEQEFCNMCLAMLGGIYPEPSLMGVYDGIVCRLIADGYKFPLRIRQRATGKSTSVDLSQITTLKWEFVIPLSICITLCDVDIPLMQQAFEKLQNCGVQLGQDVIKVRQIAYCLLKMTAKQGELGEDIADMFVEKDFELYDEYLQRQSDNASN